MDRLKFVTKADLKSTAWVNFERDLQLRLAELQRENENDLDAMKTARIRGRIAEIRSILALSADPGMSDVSDN